MDSFEQQARDRLEAEGGFELEQFAASFQLFRLATQYLSHLESSIHRPQGISTAGFRVLFTVWAYDEMEPRQIARLSGVSTAAVSGVLNTLVAGGLITKEQDEKDRRLRQVQLTTEGREVLLTTYRNQNRMEKAFFSHMSGSELAELTSNLRALLGRLE